MTLLPNREQIEFLVERQFRGLARDHQGRVGTLASSEDSPSPEVVSRTYPNMHEARKAYRAELLEKDPEEIQTLYEVECAKQRDEERAKAELEEGKRFFNQPSAAAEITHWSRTSYWSLDEATALSLGKEPRVVDWDNVKSFTAASPFARKYERLRDLILRAQAVEQLNDPVLPGFYIAWAKRNEIAVPADLEAAVVARGEHIGRLEVQVR